MGRTDTDEAVATPHPLAPPAPDEYAPVDRFVDECPDGSTGVLAAAACPITHPPDSD
jgi:hypothetical protein